MGQTSLVCVLHSCSGLECSGDTHTHIHRSTPTHTHAHTCTHADTRMHTRGALAPDLALGMRSLLTAEKQYPASGLGHRLPPRVWLTPAPSGPQLLSLLSYEPPKPQPPSITSILSPFRGPSYKPRSFTAAPAPECRVLLTPVQSTLNRSSPTPRHQTRTEHLGCAGRAG